MDKVAAKIEIPTKLLDNHRLLSECSANFLRFVSQNPEGLKRSTYQSININSVLFRLQPWPTFVNQRCMSEIKNASVSVCKLVQSIPQRFFDNNPRKIAQYFGMSESKARDQLAGATESHVKNLFSRGDFVLSPQGLKCLEYNVTPSLGGLDVSQWEFLYKQHPLIAQFLKDYQVKIVNQNLFAILLENLFDFSFDHVFSKDQEINIVFVLPRVVMNRFQYLEMYFNLLLNKILTSGNQKRSGHVFICYMNQLQIQDGFLFFKDKKIHSLIEMNDDGISDEIMSIFKAGRLFIYNGPIANLLSNKLILAFLSENAENDIFSPEEKNSIRRYIAWTRRLIPGFTYFGQQRVQLIDFVLENQKNLVIKAGEGFGGSDVHVGKKTPAGEWRSLIEKRVKDKNWLVQEYIESYPFLYQQNPEGFAEHHLVWGFFVFGQRYGGGWMRLLNKENKKGIINAHQGAESGVIFEVEE